MRLDSIFRGLTFSVTRAARDQPEPGTRDLFTKTPPAGTGAGVGRLAPAGSGGVSQDPVGAGWAPPGGAGVGASLASPRPLGPGAGLHLLPPPATSSSPGCHLSRGVSLGQFSPIPHPPWRVSCLGRGWRDISWTVSDPSGEGRGVAAAAQSLPLQVSVGGGRGMERGQD